MGHLLKVEPDCQHAVSIPQPLERLLVNKGQREPHRENYPLAAQGRSLLVDAANVSIFPDGGHLVWGDSAHSVCFNRH